MTVTGVMMVTPWAILSAGVVGLFVAVRRRSARRSGRARSGTDPDPGVQARPRDDEETNPDQPEKGPDLGRIPAHVAKGFYMNPNTQCAGMSASGRWGKSDISGVVGWVGARGGVGRGGRISQPEYLRG
jgi:hypothetical protein